MRIFSFISSLITLVFTVFFLVTEFPMLDTLNGIIYLLLMLILLFICITGIIINMPLSARPQKRFRIVNHAKH